MVKPNMLIFLYYIYNIIYIYICIFLIYIYILIMSEFESRMTGISFIG